MVCLEATGGVTDDGIITLAKVIDARKLPEVRFLGVHQLHKTGLTTLALDAICQASVNSCPKLTITLIKTEILLFGRHIGTDGGG